MYCLKLKGILAIIIKPTPNDSKKNALVVFLYKYLTKTTASQYFYFTISEHPYSIFLLVFNICHL